MQIPPQKISCNNILSNKHSLQPKNEVPNRPMEME